jgi:hypothetical protein
MRGQRSNPRSRCAGVRVGKALQFASATAQCVRRPRRIGTPAVFVSGRHATLMCCNRRYRCSMRTRMHPRAASGTPRALPWVVSVSSSQEHP